VPVWPNYDAPVAADLAREAMLHRLAALVPGDGSTAPCAAAATSWRPVDDDLAVLVYDSRLDPDLLAVVRSSGTAHRQLTFQAHQVVLELDVVDGAPPQMTCQLVPPQPARLTIRHRSGAADVGEDRHGFFHVPRLPAGPVSLRCAPLAEGAEPVATSWLAL
jgi:hypothetical protein